MTAPALSNALKPARPDLPLQGGVGLRPGRVHEACGPARRTFAIWAAGRTRGSVLWIAPAWETERIDPDGMRPLADPGRFLFVRPRRAADLLWCTEEALRAGAASIVIADLPEPPALTPVRRLQLAAEAAGTAPLGLLLTPGDGGARGVESRWHMAPAHRDRAQRWLLERRRARMQPPRRWLAHLPDSAGAEWALTPDNTPGDPAPASPPRITIP